MILSVIFFVSSTCVNVHLSFILASFIYYLLLDGTQCRPIVVIDSGVIFSDQLPAIVVLSAERAMLTGY